MSLKLLKLRLKILFWTVTGKMKKLHSRLQLTLSQGNPENVLIIFPADEPSFRVAYYTFRDLGHKPSQRMNYTSLVQKQFRDLFHQRMGETIYINEFYSHRRLSDERSLLLKLNQRKT